MQNIYMLYMNLSPGVENQFANKTHQCVVGVLRKHFPKWTDFHDKYEGYSLFFTIVTQKENLDLFLKDSKIRIKKKSIDFVIYMPNIDLNLFTYIKYLFEGIEISLINFEVSSKEIEQMKQEVLKQFL